MKGRRILSIVLALLVFVGAVRMPLIASAVDGDGMTFSQSRMYVTSENLGDAPKTYEAVIKIPSTFTGRAGVIMGNYYGATNGFSLEIYGNKPRLYITEGKVNYDVYFNEVSALNTGEWIHLAIVHEGPNSIKCYIDGVLQQTLTSSRSAYYPTNPDYSGNGLDVPHVSTTGTLIIGGDHRYSSSAGANAQYFQGSIKSLALYSDVRTASEVQSDQNGQYGDNLVARYDMSNLSTTVAKIEDLSGNGYDANFENFEKRAAKSPSSYDYAFAVVGDTQCINDAAKQRQYLDTLDDWIAENVESKKIKYVFGLGDITENQTDVEYTHAVENLKKLNGLVPYSLIRGNHDNSNEKFSSFFNYDGYTSQIGGRYEASSLNNVWMEFAVGDVKYLVLALDYSPSTDVLAWACGVVENHPEHNVIITTHGYLNRDGSRLNTTGNKLAVPANNGDVIWENLGKKYENICMILAGHDPTNEVVISTATGDNGNTVTQMLIDPQSMDKNFLDLNLQPAGMVAMFYVSNGGSTIQIDYYSTIRDAYWGETKTITVDVVGCEHANTTTHNRVDATCTTPGHEAYTSCDDCGAVVSGVNAEIPTTAHSMTHYEKIPASPTEAGRIEYWECSICNKKYSDAEGTQVTTDLAIPPFGKELALSSASLSLGDSISLNFYANKNGLDESEYQKPFVRIIVDNKETIVTGVEKDGVYVFEYNKLAAHQMNETISVVLCAEARGVICSSEMLEYSIAQYCYDLLEESADDAKLRTLIVDILNYGAAAQTYAGDTGTLVNANLTATQKAWASANPTLTNIANKNQTTISNPTVTWKGAGLNLTGKVTLRLKVQAADVQGLSVKVKGFDNCVASFEKISDGNYYIYLQGFMFTQLNEVLDITVYSGETAVSNTLRYSIGSYAYANQSGNLGALMQNMMKLGNAASAYKTQ